MVSDHVIQDLQQAHDDAIHALDAIDLNIITARNWARLREAIYQARVTWHILDLALDGQRAEGGAPKARRP